MKKFILFILCFTGVVPAKQTMTPDEVLQWLDKTYTQASQSFITGYKKRDYKLMHQATESQYGIDPSNSYMLLRSALITMQFNKECDLVKEDLSNMDALTTVIVEKSCNLPKSKLYPSKDPFQQLTNKFVLAFYHSSDTALSIAKQQMKLKPQNSMALMHFAVAMSPKDCTNIQESYKSYGDRQNKYHDITDLADVIIETKCNLPPKAMPAKQSKAAAKH